MDIYYYPNGKKQKEPPVNIGCIVGALVYRERSKGNLKGWNRIRLLASAGACQICGGAPAGRGAISIHHIKPVWAHALDFVLKSPPKTYQENNDMVYEVALGRLQLPPDCGAAENLQVLCHSCHEKAEVKARAYWLRHFEKNYPVKCEIK